MSLQLTEADFFQIICGGQDFLNIMTQMVGNLFHAPQPTFILDGAPKISLIKYIYNRDKIIGGQLPTPPLGDPTLLQQGFHPGKIRDAPIDVIQIECLGACERAQTWCRRENKIVCMMGSNANYTINPRDIS